MEAGKSGRYRHIEIKQDPEDMRYALYILNKIYRKAQMKAVRHMQEVTRQFSKGKLDSKGRRNPGINMHIVMIRSHTWEHAAALIMKEMEGIKWQLQNRTMNKDKEISTS